MLGPLGTTTINALAFGKLLFFGALVVGVFGYRRLEKTKQWFPLAGVVILGIIALQASIFLGVHTLWNLLSGDELLVAANYQRVIGNGFGHDFVYQNLPPFYPPLFFYMVGGIGQLLHLSGVGAAKLGAAIATAFVPFIVWAFARPSIRQADSVFAKPYVWLLLSLLPFVTVDYPSLLTKPYEFLSAISVLLWFIWTQRLAIRPEKPYRWLLVSGVIGAILFSTYYLWFVMVAIAVLISCPWYERSRRWVYFGRWAAVAGLTAVGSAWYWIPLALSYRQFGMENWQPAFFIASDFNFFPPLEFTLRSFWLWLGLAALLCYRRREVVRPALYLLAATYVWQIMSLAATLFGDAPFQAARGFTFLGEIILSFGAAYGVAAWLSPVPHGFSQIKEILRDRIQGVSIPSSGTPATRFFIAWLILCVGLPFGLWLDQESTKQRIEELRKSDRATEMFTTYFRTHPADAQLSTLSFHPKLNAFTALPQYISYNQHYSHPAANFSQRFNYLASISSAPTAQEFHRRFILENPYAPIEQLILYEYQGNYELYFWLDDYPNGGREAVVRWPTNLIAEPYFTPVPELSIGDFHAWRPLPAK